MKITELNLSVRTAKCLELAGIEEVSDLNEWEDGELLRLRNFGLKCLAELKASLAIHGWTYMPGVYIPGRLVRFHSYRAHAGPSFSQCPYWHE